MTEQEMKKLGRGDLLELLLSQAKENESLRAELQEVKRELSDRRVKIEEAGSLAEAMVSINGLVKAVQKTADEYLENIRNREEASNANVTAALQTAEKQSTTMVREAEAKAVEIIKAAEETAAAKLQETEAKCADLETNAKARSEMYWKQISEKMEAFYQAHQGLKELMSTMNMQE